MTFDSDVCASATVWFWNIITQSTLDTIIMSLTNYKPVNSINIMPIEKWMGGIDQVMGHSRLTTGYLGDHTRSLHP